MINEQIFQELSNTTFKQITENCIYLKKISNTLYGDAEILAHKTKNAQLLLITRIYHRKEQVKKVEAESALRMNLKSDKILRLVSYNVRNVNELCGNFYRFQWIYEFSGYTLYDCIQSRKKKNQPFSNEELIQLMKSLLSGFQILKAVSIRHGYIQPKHVIYSQEKKIYCISDIRFMTNTHECQELRQKTENIEQCFLSPEALKEVSQRGSSESSNYEKNEVFSIGMLLLNCMLLDYPDVYDKVTKEINNELLDKYLRTVSQGFALAQLVKEMLQTDNYHRPSLDQLISLLQQFQFKQQYVPLQSSSPYILHIDQSQVSPNQSFEIKYPPQGNNGSEITPTRKIDHKSKKPSYFTPITHLTHSPVSQIKNDISEISTISQKTYQEPTNNKSIMDISLLKDPFNFTYRQTPTPEKKTKPCPSPFRSIALNPITNSHRSNYYTPNSPLKNNSFSISQQEENKQISYDFASMIKLDVPNSLKVEFKKLENTYKRI